MTRMETAIQVKPSKNHTVRKRECLNLENLIKECNQVKSNWGLKQNDIVFVLAVSSMIESGFQCDFRKEDRKCQSDKIEKTLPNDWKHQTRQVYEAQFVLPPYFNCPVKLVALPAGDILCINIIAPNISPKHVNLKSLAIHSPCYVPRPEEDAVLNKLSDLNDFQYLLRNFVIWPIRCSILSDQGIMNGSLFGIPDEIKLKIVRHLPIPDVLVLSETCHDLNRICNNQHLWKLLFHDFYKHLCKCTGESQKCDETTDWKEAFKQCYINKKYSKSYQNSPSESFVTATEAPYGSEIDFDID